MTNVLLTGACGFIGSHFVEAILKEETDWNIVGLDRVDGTSSLRRLETDALHEDRGRFHFVWHDLRSPINDLVGHDLLRFGPFDYVLHLAASTHVDRSITHPMSAVYDNVVGTTQLLEWVRRHYGLKKFVHFSTDEVYGSAPPGVAFTENQPFKSGNPYAASKAAAVEIGQSFHNTFGLPVVTTFCANVIGERQAVEKFVPLAIRKILLGEKILIHADPTKTKPAQRMYIHARNVWNAIRFLLDHGVAGERYNIAGDIELDCLELVHRIQDIIGKRTATELVDFHGSRPGHDLRYSLDGGKLRTMGFAQPVTFEASLQKTVRWFLANPTWLGLDLEMRPWQARP